MRGPWVASLLLLALVAGCVDESEPGLVSAREALPRAEAAAQEWSPDAVLVGVSTFEVGEDERGELAEALADAEDQLAEAERACRDGEEESCEWLDEERGELAALRAVAEVRDDRPGDGRAALWSFRFQSTQADARYDVLVDADEVLLTAETAGAVPFGFESLAAPPLGPWPVDSTDAARVALEGDAGFAAAVGAGDASAFTDLRQADGGPVWLLGVWGDEGELAAAAVDAVDATLLDVEDVLEEYLPVVLEQGGDAGTFTAAVGTEAVTSFEVQEEGHAALALHVQVQPPPLSPVSVTVTAPDGREETFGVPTALGISSEAVLVLEDVPAGAYEVALRTSLAAQQDWTFSWCTDGEDFGAAGFLPNPACGEVPAEGAGAAAHAETVSRWLRLPGA